MHGDVNFEVGGDTGAGLQSVLSPIHFSPTVQVIVVDVCIVIVIIFFFGKGVIFISKPSSGIISDFDSGWHVLKGIENNWSTHCRESPQRAAASLLCTSSGGFDYDDCQRWSILREQWQVACDDSSEGAQSLQLNLVALYFTSWLDWLGIGLDNMAAIQASTLRTPRAGRYLTDIFHAAVRDLKVACPHLRLTPRWVPGHLDVPGNKAADVAAKEVLHEVLSATHLLPKLLRKPLLFSTSRARQNFQLKLEQRAGIRWWTSWRGMCMAEVDGAMPSKKYGVLIADLPQWHTNLLIQFRTNHVPLQAYMERIGKVTSKAGHGSGSLRRSSRPNPELGLQVRLVQVRVIRGCGYVRVQVASWDLGADL